MCVYISMNLGRNWVADVAVVIIVSMYMCKYVCVCVCMCMYMCMYMCVVGFCTHRRHTYFYAFGLELGGGWAVVIIVSM
jgi:hypothetical protein